MQRPPRVRQASPEPENHRRNAGTNKLAYALTPTQSRKVNEEVKLSRTNFMKISTPLMTKSPKRTRFEEEPRYQTSIREEGLKLSNESNKLQSEIDVMQITIKHMKEEMKVLCLLDCD